MVSPRYIDHNACAVSFILGVSLCSPIAMGEQRLTPRIKETAQALWSIYLGLTIVCALLYYLGGMSLFDAVSHAMSTVAIGGFSTHNESIGYFNSTTIEIICIVFMLLSAFSFTLHYFAIYRRKPLKYFYDPDHKSTSMAFFCKLQNNEA